MIKDYPDPFRSALSYTIFKQKYLHENAETWEELSHTLVEEVCGDFLSSDDKDQLKSYISSMKFIPGGRYLYYAGRSAKYYNNCFRKGTKILTDKGWRNVEQLGEANVISPVDGQPKKAVFSNFGKQKLQRVTFTSKRGHQRHTWTVDCTRTHRWILEDGQDTYDLRVGDVVPSPESKAYVTDNLAWWHGFLFGDGNSNGQVRLCGLKSSYLALLPEGLATITYPESAEGDPVLYFNQKGIAWKELPHDKVNDINYIANFICGWLSADGHSDRILNSVNKEHIEWFREYAAYANIVITGALRSQTRDVILGGKEYKDHTIYIQNFQYGEYFGGFKVSSIEDLGIEEDVFCATEPQYEQLIIQGNIVTSNCYLLKAEEDSREDWADLSWKAESCLMTGGGIGVDYSVYRDSKSTLSRTGGRASGPIPKMFMINEIGRNVMQGGTRRSAIYASLNHKHGDIDWFLNVKDWGSQKIPGTDVSFKEAKERDFNFNAPLDMTNISVNYDTDWLVNFYRTGDVGKTFLENARHALTSGEPGFSFNFLDKENETLRNACCEVTSEDDSDVCNLGSLNFSRIRNVEELKDVVELATMFLICGTLKAQLPYDKVYDVRAKNRRLGLGIMGLHEWLIMRGYRYEVVPELHQWLNVYKGVSNDTADKFADRLGISRPVAKRAIAPTGTIGLISGTSTGIEPVFAVAYKRRYLTNGSKWRYQYEIDHTAQTIVERYGLNPGDIETSLSLTDDFERRIKFQADVQDYVDMAISSTINLPSPGSRGNTLSDADVRNFANTLARYAPRLRGFTCYPDGARGGQPLTVVPYEEAVGKLGEEFEEHVVFNDVCDLTGGGHCGL